MSVASAVSPSPTWRASLIVAGSALVWGCWWIPLREIDSVGLKGDWTNVVVLSIAALSLTPFLLRQPARLLRGGPMVWGAGIFLGAMFSTYQHGLIAGDVVRVTLLFYLAPVWGTLLGILFLGDRFAWQRVVVVALGFAGAMIILESEDGIPSPRNLAEWMGLASGIVFAIGATFAYRVTGSYELEKVWLSLAFGAALSAVFAVVNPLVPMPSADQVLAAAPLATGVAMLVLIPITWAMIWGAQRLDPGRLSLLFMLEVVAASISSTLVAGEPYGVEKLVGTVMVLTAGGVEALSKPRV